MFTRHRTLFAIVISTALCLAIPQSARAAGDPEIEKLRRDLQARLTALDVKTKLLIFCDDQQKPCPIRLWVEQSFISSLITTLLANRQITFSYTGTSNGPFADGGDCLGCGWYADIDALGAQIVIQRASPGWNVSNPANPIVTVRPTISFAAQVQVRGVIKGPAGPCDWQIWKTSCNCPIGGGFGTSVGASASLTDTMEFRVGFRTEGSGLRVLASIPTDKVLRATAQVGLGAFGTATFPLDLKVPATQLSSSAMSLAFGSSGQVDIAGNVTKYTFSLANPTLRSEKGGLALRWDASVKWQ
jgi:hypothetical protein